MDVYVAFILATVSTITIFCILFLCALWLPAARCCQDRSEGNHEFESLEMTGQVETAEIVIQS